MEENGEIRETVIETEMSSQRCISTASPKPSSTASPKPSNKACKEEKWHMHTHTKKNPQKT
jgi:hypothetical protein